MNCNHRVQSNHRQSSYPCMFFSAFTLLSLFTGVGCDTKSEETEGGNTSGVPPELPGMLVDCDPNDDPASGLLCMLQDDWSCPLSGHYVRESLCANVHGGTPGDYDGKPVLVEMGFDCLSEKPGVQSVIGYNPGGCTDCACCGLQIGGHQKWEYDMDDAGWNELDCPDVLPGECDPPQPTTGDDAGDGGDTTGGLGGSGVWVCNGSTMLMGTYAEGTLDEVQWTMAGGVKPDCRTATDEEDARGRCKELCGWKNDAHQMDADMNGATWDPFECNYFDDSDPPPVEIAANEDIASICNGGGPMDFPQPANVLPFTGDAVLDIASGHSVARSSQWSGLVDFAILEPCSPTRAGCQVSLADIRASGGSLRGIHDDGVSVRTFEIENPQVQLLQPVLGIVHAATGEVQFPDQDLFLVVTTDTMSIDGFPVHSGPFQRIVTVDAPKGRWDGSRLDLEFNWQTDGLTFSIALTTGPASAP